METYSVTEPQSNIHSAIIHSAIIHSAIIHSAIIHSAIIHSAIIRNIFTWSKSKPYDMFVEVISIIAFFQDIFQKESAWLI